MCEFTISEIQILPLRPKNGLVGFASCVINSQFYIGNIAIYTSLSNPGTYRLLYPNKLLANGGYLKIFYPINKETGDQFQNVITQKYEELMRGTVETQKEEPI